MWILFLLNERKLKILETQHTDIPLLLFKMNCSNVKRLKILCKYLVLIVKFELLKGKEKNNYKRYENQFPGSNHLSTPTTLVNSLFQRWNNVVCLLGQYCLFM